MTTRRVPLKCACCGTYAGKWEQWPNQDTGYGICQRCVRDLRHERDWPDAEIERVYGKEDIHWGEYFDGKGKPKKGRAESGAG